MALDALDPGPNGDYPNLDLTLQPTGTRTHVTPDGDQVLIDVEATNSDGVRVSELGPTPTPLPPARGGDPGR